MCITCCGQDVTKHVCAKCLVCDPCCTGTTYTCLFILVTASLSGIKPGLATKPPQSAQVAPGPWGSDPNPNP